MWPERLGGVQELEQIFLCNDAFDCLVAVCWWKQRSNQKFLLLSINSPISIFSVTTTTKGSFSRTLDNCPIDATELILTNFLKRAFSMMSCGSRVASSILFNKLLVVATPAILPFKSTIGICSMSRVLRIARTFWHEAEVDRISCEHLKFSSLISSETFLLHQEWPWMLTDSFKLRASIQLSTTNFVM